MSDLTDMGYIVQPHTSAGRIPSDKGYRLYVDELMKEKEEKEAALEEKMDRWVYLNDLAEQIEAQKNR